MLDFDRLLRDAVERGASDVHVKVGARPRLRIDGELVEAGFETVEPGDTERIVAAILPTSRVDGFRRTHEADFTYGIAGLGRFRASAFRQRGWTGLVLRRVLPGIPGFDALALPPVVSRLADEAHGLVLVAGLAASGKTATLAAMVDHINTTRSCHIVTVEDPIEVLHADKRAIVDQREVGADTVGVREALVHALRQDPDVVMLGELTDSQAVGAALQAADAGHLVLACLPAVNAVEVVQRVVDLFPPHEQDAVRSTLARTLRGVVAQRLLPRVRGRGRVPAVEVLVGNARVAERILASGRTAELEHEMAEGDLYGMQTFDQSLLGLYRDGLIDRANAISHASAPAELRVALDRIEFDRGRVFASEPSAPTIDPTVAASR